MTVSTQQPRLIILHKQSTSARVRFLAFGNSLLAFEPLPASASLHQDGFAAPVQFHPAAAIRAAETRLGLDVDALEAIGEFCVWVHTPDGDLAVMLAACTSIDPPFDAAERNNARFIAMTEARCLPPIERDILRRAYEHVLG